MAETLHLYPFNDTKVHVLSTSTKCPCNPRVEIDIGGVLIIHNSWDMREVYSEVRGLPEAQPGQVKATILCPKNGETKR